MQKQCPTCNGSGQISYFLGESRFLLTYEECPDCMGTGIVQEENDSEQNSFDEQD